MNKLIKSFLISLLLLGLLFSIGCSTASDSTDLPPYTPLSPTNSSDYSTYSSVQFAAAMKCGWNLGNTFDAHITGNKTNHGLSTETSWGMPETTQAMINAVAAKGLKTIRNPISWHNHITDGTNYTIDEKWLARI